MLESLTKIGAVVLVGAMIVGPMDRAARNVQAPAQFFTVDLFGLAVLLQVATLPTAWMLQIDDGLWNTAMGTGIFTWTASTAIWWASTRSLSRAGVGRPLKRIVFSTLVLPFTLVCIVAVTLGNFVLIAWAGGSLDTPAWFKMAALVGLNVGVGLAAYSGRRTTQWILADPTLNRAPSSVPK